MWFSILELAPKYIIQSDLLECKFYLNLLKSARTWHESGLICWTVASNNKYFMNKIDTKKIEHFQV